MDCLQRFILTRVKEKSPRSIAFLKSSILSGSDYVLELCPFLLPVSSPIFPDAIRVVRCPFPTICIVGFPVFLSPFCSIKAPGLFCFLSHIITSCFLYEIHQADRRRKAKRSSLPGGHIDWKLSMLPEDNFIVMALLDGQLCAGLSDHR